MAEKRTAAVFSDAGKRTGEVALDPEIFGLEPNVAVMHQVVTAQLAAARAGTAKTKTRSEVRGGGRKPWRQKGTGRARVGSTRTPIWRKGGIVFGPTPRDYSYRLGRQKQRHALQMALTVKRRDDQIVVVDELSIEAPKTKNVARMLADLDLQGKVWIAEIAGTRGPVFRWRVPVLPELDEGIAHPEHGHFRGGFVQADGAIRPGEIAVPACLLHHLEAEQVAIKSQRRVEIRHGYGHMVQSDDHVLCPRWLRSDEPGIPEPVGVRRLADTAVTVHSPRHVG